MLFSLRREAGPVRGFGLGGVADPRVCGSPRYVVKDGCT